MRMFGYVGMECLPGGSCGTKGLFFLCHFIILVVSFVLSGFAFRISFVRCEAHLHLFTTTILSILLTVTIRE